MFRHNKDYNHLASEGLQEPVLLDQQDKKDVMEEQKAEVKEAQEALNNAVNDDQAINYQGLLYLKPPKENPLTKQDKLSDYYEPSEVKQSKISKVETSSFFPVHPKASNIVRQRKKHVQRLGSYTKTLTNNVSIQWRPVVGHGCYIDPAHSYIKFNLESNKDATLGVGSAANIINRATFRTSSNHIFTHDNVNHVCTIEDYWMKKGDYFGSIAYRAKGYGNTALFTGVSKFFNIPLADIIPLFKTHDMLSPEMLNNSEITLELEDPSVALYRNNLVDLVNGLEYKVSNISIVYDCHFVDSKFIDDIHKRDYTVKTMRNETLRKNTKGKITHELQADTSNKAFYVVAKKIFQRKAQQEQYEQDSFQFVRPSPTNESSSYQWKTGINNYPEVEDENQFENEQHNERILSPDMRVISMSNYYVETLNLSRNRENNDGIQLDDRNQITYEYKTFTSEIDILFVKYVEQVVTVKGEPVNELNYQDNEVEVVD
jgi:hypothetical protein